MGMTMVDIAGPYVTACAALGNDLSPLIVNEDDTVLVAGQKFDASVGSVNGYMVIDGVQVGDQTVSLELLFSLQNGEASFTGSANQDPISGHRLFAYKPPALDDVFPANGLLDVFEGGEDYQDNISLATLEGVNVVLATDGTLCLATGNESGVELGVSGLAGGPQGASIALQQASNNIAVNAQNLLQVQANVAPSGFDLWLTPRGTALISWTNPATQQVFYVMPNAQGQLLAVAVEGYAPAMEFNVTVSAFPEPEEILRRRGAIIPEAMSECDMAKATLAWQCTGQLFMAIGLGPYIKHGTPEVGILALLRTNDKVAAAVDAIWIAIKADPTMTKLQAALMGAKLLEVIYQNGLLWPVVKFCINFVAWEIVLKLVAYLVEFLFAVEALIAELLGSIVAWVGELIVVATDVHTKCAGPAEAG